MVYFMIFVVGAVFMYRNELVFRCRTRAHKVVFADDNGLWWHEARTLLFADGRRSYHGMVLDLTRWTFADFYPELVGREKP